MERWLRKRAAASPRDGWKWKRKGRIKWKRIAPRVEEKWVKVEFLNKVGLVQKFGHIWALRFHLFVLTISSSLKSCKPSSIAIFQMTEKKNFSGKVESYFSEIKKEKGSNCVSLSELEHREPNELMEMMFCVWSLFSRFCLPPNKNSTVEKQEKRAQTFFFHLEVSFFRSCECSVH